MVSNVISGGRSCSIQSSTIKDVSGVVDTRLSYELSTKVKYSSGLERALLGNANWRLIFASNAENFTDAPLCVADDSSYLPNLVIAATVPTRKPRHDVTIVISVTELSTVRLIVDISPANGPRTMFVIISVENLFWYSIAISMCMTLRLLHEHCMCLTTDSISSDHSQGSDFVSSDSMFL